MQTDRLAHGSARVRGHAAAPAGALTGGDSARAAMLLDFSVTIERPTEAACVVAASGELDLYTVPQLAAALASALRAPARRVIVDLAGTTFFDSTALLALDGFRRRVESQLERTLIVVSPNPAVTRVFTITGFEDRFSIVETRAEAMGAGSGGDAS